YRLLHIFLCAERRTQDATGALQLHLRPERRSLAHCRPSFLGHAPGAEIAVHGAGIASGASDRIGVFDSLVPAHLTGDEWIGLQINPKGASGAKDVRPLIVHSSL